MTILEGTAYWMHTADVNNKGNYPSGKFEIVVGNLDERSIQEIKDLGMEHTLKNIGDEKGTFVKMKNKKRPPLMYPDKEEYPTDTLVGNGSKVKVQCKTYVTQNGTFYDWQKTMVMDMVEFAGSSDSEFDTVGTQPTSDFEVAS